MSNPETVRNSSSRSDVTAYLIFRDKRSQRQSQQGEQGQHADVGPGNGQQMKNAAADQFLLGGRFQPAAVAEDGGLEENPRRQQHVRLPGSALRSPGGCARARRRSARQKTFALAVTRTSCADLRIAAQMDLFVEQVFFVRVGIKIPVQAAGAVSWPPLRRGRRG